MWVKWEDKINEDQTCVEKLKNELAKTQLKNGSYSLRAYARDLNVCHSFLSKVLNGKKPASPRLAYQLGKHMKLSPNEILDLITSTFH